MKKAFEALTSMGQVRRLRRMVLKALAHYDLDVRRVRLITNDMNGIFRIDTAEDERYIMRVALPAGGHSMAHLCSEMDWLSALSRDTALTVPKPLATRDGQFVIEVACEGVPEPRLCMVFSWVPGTDLADRLNSRNVMKLGRLSAELHRHAASFVPSQGFDILRFDTVFPFPEPVVIFSEAFDALFPPERQAVFRQGVGWAAAAIEALIASGESMRVIHGDLHQWNVRWYRGALSPIDFEDMMWGWPVQDIAITLYYLWQHPEYTALRQAFQHGYERISPWPERYTGEINAFIAARAVGMANFVIQNHDPEWGFEPDEFVARSEARLLTLLTTKA